MAALQVPANSVWSSMSYIPPRGPCNFKNGIMSGTCPCLRFMLHPVKAATSFECDGCGHHASFHSLENPREAAILSKWRQADRQATLEAAAAAAAATPTTAMTTSRRATTGSSQPAATSTTTTRSTTQRGKRKRITAPPQRQRPQSPDVFVLDLTSGQGNIGNSRIVGYEVDGDEHDDDDNE